MRLFHGYAAVQSISTYSHDNEYETTNVTKKERKWCEPPRNVSLLFRPAQGDYPYEKLGIEKWFESSRIEHGERAAAHT